MPGKILRDMIPAMCPRSSPLVQDQITRLIPYLHSTIPVEQDKDIYTLLHNISGGDYSRATKEFLMLVMYFLSNKLFDRNDSARICDKLLEWFEMGNNHLLLQDMILHKHKMPTIEALAEGIFASTLRAGNVAIAKMFLDSGLEPNIIISMRSDFRGYTAIQMVARIGDVHMAKLLLEFKANVHATNSSFAKSPRYDLEPTQTPLQIAARAGNTEIVRLFISEGAVVNMSDESESSALQNAIMAGNAEITSLLIQEGADIDASFGGYGCSLECAIRIGADNLAGMLLERGSDINCRGKSPFYKNTPLQSAIMVEDHNMIERLLKRGVDVNSPAADGGRTALQWAAEKGYLELCRALMNAGANVNAAPAASGPGITTLAAAVSSGNHQLVELLLQHGADVNCRSGSITALRTATWLNDVKMVRLLLSVGADTSRDGLIADATRAKNPELILTLLEAGANINQNFIAGTCALTIAAETNDVNLVQFLLSKGAHPNITCDPERRRFRLPLVEATKCRNFHMIEMLLEAGADCGRADSGGLNALQTAAKMGDIELVRYFLKAGADVNLPAAFSHGLTALQAAVKSRNIELIQFLISEGADLNSPAAENWGRTALQGAVSNQDIDLVRTLLAAGAYADEAPSKYGDTSLTRAASNGDNDLIELLLDKGANINYLSRVAGDKHRTALLAAVDCGHYHTVQLLIDRGANINYLNRVAGDKHRTALLAAVHYGHYHTVQLLIDSGANVNAPGTNATGETALQCAASSGYLGIAKLLLAAGAFVNAPGGKTCCGWTALETAAAHGRIDMLKLLLIHGADITTDWGRRQLKKALKLATETGHNAAAKFLKYHQLC
jgi:ankyrin repeat protein